MIGGAIAWGAALLCLAGWCVMKVKYWRTQMQCQHLQARTIHGDEAAGLHRRGYCDECGLYLAAPPHTTRGASASW